MRKVKRDGSRGDTCQRKGGGAISIAAQRQAKSVYARKVILSSTPFVAFASFDTYYLAGYRSGRMVKKRLGEGTMDTKVWMARVGRGEE